ncbi:histidine kinase [Aureimonas sp. Leaf454]|uniref:PAS domain-containing sensor histidine kinase n=1 Tax=Aureimonas sp. Leaf454 TaxID=1736381 RepID=UPI0006F71563|nr:PAS domain S-box protein [Aureimonas sp. Leaf454]KQT45299.1 histidine kinase [Aureimonas sp. Leaf454]
MGFADQDETAALRSENADLRVRLAALGAEQPAPPARAPSTDERRYRRIVESAVDHAIIAAGPDGIITDWNEAAESIFGWSARQMIGRALSSIFTPEDIEAGIHEREMRFALTLGKAHDDRWHIKADGSRFFASGQMMPLSDEADRPIGYLKILRDKTIEEAHRREIETSRERLQFALDASALVGTWDWDVVGDLVYADQRFADLYGVDAERAAAGAPLGLYSAGIHPDDLARVQAEIEAALTTGEPYSSEYRTIDIKGDLHWVRARGRCFLGAEGKPERFPGAIVDITGERRRAARQAALLQIGDDLLSGAGPADYKMRALEILGETLELDRVGYARIDTGEETAFTASAWTREGCEPMPRSFDLAQFGPGFVPALRTGTVLVEDVTAHPATAEGAEAFLGFGVSSAAHVTVVENGRIRVLLFLHDRHTRHWAEDDVAFIREVLNRAWSFSERRRTQTALVEAETRLRLAHEAAEIGSFDFDLATGELLWDERCKACFGLASDARVDYETVFLPGLHPDDRERVTAEVAVVLDPESTGNFESVYRTIGREDGKIRHVHASGQTVVREGKTIRFVGAVRDVTEEKQAEERQLLLTRELQHRVKNTLAMVNALANQTLRRAPNVQEGLAAFSARLIALSHAHDILTQTSWTSAPIGAIVSQSLESHRTKDGERFSWSGPDIRLNAKQSLALALALHELATNAAKYGALSGEEGKVAIRWRIEGGDEARLVFEWRESGGPRVEEPSSRGFGSRLIQQSLALEFGGEVEIDYRPEGVVCRIDAPLHEDGDGGEPVVG